MISNFQMPRVGKRSYFRISSKAIRPTGMPPLNRVTTLLTRASVLGFLSLWGGQSLNAEKPEDLSKIRGRIQFVKSFPDYKVKIVDSFADLHVKRVTSFPNSSGKWQIVESFPDFKIQIVESFPDFKIKYVESFPGVP
ncbi:MAG: hypothetical protein P1U86_18855 [Verrucomicrobiales bacterium]|nr:hypothetical protein [Verrucomicrobiales bacterium]